MSKNKEAASENKGAFLAKGGKLFSIIGYALIILAVAFTVFIVIKNKSNEIKIDYSKGLTKEGLIKDIDVDACIEAPDYKNMTLYAYMIELTEDELQQKIDEMLSDYWSADENGNQIDTEFTEEFCQEQFGMSCDEYKKMLNDETKEERIAEYIQEILETETVVKVYPQDYVNAITETLRGTDLYNYQYNNSIYYQYFGAYAYADFSDYTGMTDEEYETNLSSRAYNQAMFDMAVQYIYEHEGLTVTKDEYKSFCESIGDDVEKQYGKGYIMKNIIYDKVMDYLVENLDYVEFDYE